MDVNWYEIYIDIEMYHIDVTNSVAPEPEGSSPYLQEPATGPYSEPNGSTLHPQPVFLRYALTFWSILPSTPRSSDWSLSFGLSH
jgi:hypothetical protein